MTVKEVKQALGAWELRLRRETPKGLLDALTPFGHIVIAPGRFDPETYGDNLLREARYVGVYRGKSSSDEYLIKGAGMAFWLGDEDGKGDVFENAVTAASATFPNAVRAVLPPNGSVTEGTLHSVPGLITQTFRYETSRKAVTYLTDTFSTGSEPVSWRVNGDATLDAGPDSLLFVTDPVAMLVRRGEGRDLKLRGMKGDLSLGTDVEDYTTRVVLLAEGEGDAIATGSADAVSVPYNDLHGNTVRMTRLVSESGTAAGNAAARAQLQLNRFTNPRYSVQLTTDAYDVRGDFEVGDTILVYDPDLGFVDFAREVHWRGETINPVALKVTEMTWPVPAGWTVAFRDDDGRWFDLSAHYAPEEGATQVTVGDLRRELAGLGGEPIGTRPAADTSTPRTPVFTTPFETVAYQSDAANDVRAAVRVVWSEPLNVDGSTVLDGDHYEIRYRTTQTFSYPITWSQASTFTWDELQSWGRPLSNPVAVAGSWTTAVFGWDVNEATIIELTVAAEYEFQIRAVDGAAPPNQSPWSGSAFVTTRGDLIAPSAPAAPVVASSRIAIQVIHTLGRASGGTYNLEADLDHLEVHVGGPEFFPDSSTLVGKVIANPGMLLARIPAVSTFPIENTEDVWVKVIAVDRFGNKSDASAAVQASVALIDNAHISDLSVSKLTAGTITASIILGSEIATATEGARARMSSEGFQTYDAEGELTINLTGDPSSDQNYVNIVNNSETLASIDNEGRGTFSELNIPGDATFKGVTLDALFAARPKGVVAQGTVDLANPPPVLTTTTELGIFEISLIAEAGRNYELSLAAWAHSSQASDNVTFNVRDGGSEPPTLSSPIVARASHGLVRALTGESFFDSKPVTFTPGLHRLLLCMRREAGTGTVTLALLTGQPVTLWIEDLGPSVPNLAVYNDGSGGSSVVAPPASVTTYQKDYAATWSGTYDGSNNLVGYHGNEVHQGFNDSSVGNRRGMIGFDWAAIQADLRGATINGCWITLAYFHWWYNNGGTAVIGTHNWSGGRPGSWSGSSNRVQSGGWPRGGRRTVSLGAGIGAEFRDGSSRGIVLGPGPGGDVHQYYGRAYGAGSNINVQPVLTINYTR